MPTYIHIYYVHKPITIHLGKKNIKKTIMKKYMYIYIYIFIYIFKSYMYVCIYMYTHKSNSSIKIIKTKMIFVQNK